MIGTVYANYHRTQVVRGSITIIADEPGDPHAYRLGQQILKGLGISSNASIEMRLTLDKAYGRRDGHRMVEYTFTVVDHVSGDRRGLEVEVPLVDDQPA